MKITGEACVELCVRYKETECCNSSTILPFILKAFTDGSCDAYHMELGEKVASLTYIHYLQKATIVAFAHACV